MGSISVAGDFNVERKPWARCLSAVLDARNYVHGDREIEREFNFASYTHLVPASERILLSKMDSDLIKLVNKLQDTFHNLGQFAQSFVFFLFLQLV